VVGDDGGEVGCGDVQGAQGEFGNHLLLINFNNDQKRIIITMEDSPFNL
jgi:hypothetical protein